MTTAAVVAADRMLILHFRSCKAIPLSMNPSTQDRIARRLKALRESRGMTQEELARRMGLAHRQTLASIEAGSRRIQPEELAQAAKALRVELDELTDPFRLVGEGDFSFRADGVSEKQLRDFEERAGRWVAMLRELEDRAGVQRSRLAWKLELTDRSTFEEAHAAADELRARWRLGGVPADTLPAAVERELGVKILFVDAPRGLSGAAVHLAGSHTILINRNDPPGRRNFDLAHELFHLLTWNAMTPERVESRTVRQTKGNRVEKLAENFAGALLMPAEVVSGAWERRKGKEIHDWLNATATSLRVTSVALKWRLVVLGHLSRAQAKALKDARLAGNGGLDQGASPLPFSREFVTRVYQAVEAGHLSFRRALSLLRLPPDTFSGLCRAHGLELSYEV